MHKKLLLKYSEQRGNFQVWKSLLIMITFIEIASRQPVWYLSIMEIIFCFMISIDISISKLQINIGYIYEKVILVGGYEKLGNKYFDN